MPPSAIAYAELYVADDRDAAGFLVDSLGFVPDARPPVHRAAQR